MSTGEKGNFLDRMTEKLSAVLTPVGTRLQSVKAISSLAETMQAVMPLIIIGSFAVMFLCIDIGPWQQWLASVPGLASALGKVNALTSGAFSLFVVIILSYNYGRRLELKETVATIPLTLSVFLLLSPLEDGNIGAGTIGTQNLITALIIGLLVPRLVKILIDKNIRIRMPSGVPKFVEDGFSVLIPGIILVAAAMVIDSCFASTSYGSFTNAIYTLIQIPLSNVGLSYGGYVFVMCLSSAILWPGLHANTVMSVISPLMLAASAENQAAAAAGMALPHIVEQQFNMVCDPGGQACLLLPCLIGLFLCRSKQIREVCKVGFVPAIFGIGEPILFGLPCMFNAIMFVPMVLSTFWNVTCWYVAIATGLVGRFNGMILPWTMPPILNSVLASTTPVAAVICHIIMLAVNGLIWLPFMRIYDRQLLAEEAGR